MKKTVLFLLFIVNLLISQFSFAQLDRYCGMDVINNNIIQSDAAIKSTYLEQINQAVNDIMAYDTSLARTDSVYTVQVVVHVVYLNNNKYENIPDDIIRTQIDALNRDYNALNADSVNLRPFFVPFRGNPKIKFQLATKTPGGQATTGITHTQGALGNLAGWDPLSTLIWTALGIEPLKVDNLILTGSKGKSAWNVNKYLNIWVCDLNYGNRKCRTCLTLCDTCGALGGFAYPPSNATNWGGLALNHGNNDGLVIDFRFFGINNWFARDSTSQRFRTLYTNGRTTVHEVGHYFGLQHTWGNVVELPGGPSVDGCTIDDFMADTPEEEQAFAANLPRGTTNVCDTTINTCNKLYLGRDYPDMFENYMDYSSDLCYNLFTKQQSEIMRFNLLSRRSGLIIKREGSTVLATNQIRTAEAGIRFYPNPTSSQLTVEFSKPSKQSIQIAVYDITGKKMLAQTASTNETVISLSTENLAKGIYLLQFSNDEFIAADKFIKE